jgi:hypothetical protein
MATVKKWALPSFFSRRLDLFLLNTVGLASAKAVVSPGKVLISVRVMILSSHEFGRRHGGFLAHKKEMKPGSVGFQFWVMGHILAKLAFANCRAGDGIMAAHLAHNYTTTYLPKAAGWYNALSNDREFPGDILPR